MSMSIATPNLTDDIQPNPSLFSTCESEETIVRVLNLDHESDEKMHCLYINQNRELFRFRPTEGMSSAFMVGERYNGRNWEIKPPLLRGECSLVLKSTLPPIASISVHTNAAYVRVANSLYYINQGVKTCELVNTSPEQLAEFDAKMHPTSEAKTLTAKSLIEITNITGHILRCNAVGIFDIELQPFVNELEHPVSTKTSQTLKDLFISQYQPTNPKVPAPPSLVVNTALWTIQREELSQSFEIADEKLKNGLISGGFYADWIHLKKESLTQASYCVALISVLASTDLSQFAFSLLDEPSQSNAKNLRHHLDSNTLLYLHRRWLDEATPSFISLKNTYDIMVAWLFVEFEKYHDPTVLESITSFKRQNIREFSLAIDHLVLNDETLMALNEASNYLQGRHDIRQILLNDRRRVEVTVNNLLKQSDDRWIAAYTLFETFNNQPNLKSRLLQFSNSLASKRYEEISSYFCQLSSAQKNPTEISAAERQSINNLILNIDDLCASLNGVIWKNWKIYLLQEIYLQQPNTLTITTLTQLCKLLTTLTSPDLKIMVLKNRSPDFWLGFIHSAKDINELFSKIPNGYRDILYQSNPTLFSPLITDSIDVLDIVLQFNEKQFNSIFKKIPLQILTSFMQVVGDFRQLLDLPYARGIEKKISIILNAIPSPLRITAISTLDKLQRAFSPYRPEFKVIYFNHLSPEEWEHLLFISDAWPIIRNYLTEEHCLTILEKLSACAWRQMMKLELEWCRTHQPSTSYLYECLLNRAEQGQVPQYVINGDWDELIELLKRYFQENTSPSLFSSSQSCLSTEDQLRLAAIRDLSNLKQWIVCYFEKHMAVLIDYSKLFKAILLINAYEQALMHQPTNTEPDGPPHKRVKLG